jgi:hypothetical protein
MLFSSVPKQTPSHFTNLMQTPFPLSFLHSFALKCLAQVLRGTSESDATPAVSPLTICPLTNDFPEICALLGYYAASFGNSVPAFRDNLSVPSSRVKKSKKNCLLPLLLGLLDP